MASWSSGSVTEPAEVARRLTIAPRLRSAATHDGRRQAER